MTTLTDDQRNSAKPYTCSACGFIIEAGERYQYQRHIVDGCFYTARLHLDCYAAIGPYFGDTRREDDVWSESDFIEWLAENPGTPGAESILARAHDEGRTVRTHRNTEATP